MKTLVVENNEFVLSIFKNCFSEEELQEIDFATSYEEAIEKMDQSDYARIVATVGPDYDGSIFEEAKKRNIEKRIMVTSCAKLHTDENATCGVRKPLTVKSMRKICLESREEIKSLYGFIQQA
jgi:CheY-like chemotaxis protein